MPRFAYDARSRSGEKLEGSVEANDRRQAMDLFNKASHFPLSVFVVVLVRLLLF